MSKIEVLPRAYDLDESVNYVFTGVRRAGKSYMMYATIQQLLQNGSTMADILYLNFEDERIDRRRKKASASTISLITAS